MFEVYTKYPGRSLRITDLRSVNGNTISFPMRISRCADADCATSPAVRTCTVGATGNLESLHWSVQCCRNAEGPADYVAIDASKCVCFDLDSNSSSPKTT